MPASWLFVALAGLLGQAAPTVSPTPPRVVGGQVEEPRKVKNVVPKYPADARRAGLAGRVILECTVGPKGDVTATAVRQGFPLLNEAAIEAVRQWRYTPTLLDGVAVPVIMTVTVNFKLEAVRYDDLMASLRHREQGIREAAALNLGGLRRGGLTGTPEIRDAIVALEALAGSDPSQQVRAAALGSLSLLDGRPLVTSPAPADPQPRGSPDAAASDGSPRSIAWGTFVDPLGQCEIAENGGRLEIGVPAGAYDLSIELGQVTAPRLMRPVAGDYVAQVTVGDLPEPALGPPGQRRRPYHGAGLLVWKDERTYARLEAAVYRAADDSIVRYALFEARIDGQPAGGLAAPQLRLGGGPTDLRLTRRGRELHAQVRQGEGEWRDAGRATLELQESVSLGIAAVNRAVSPLRAGFTSFELTPAPDALPATTGADDERASAPLGPGDAPPRVRKQARPQYPQEAFLARIDGTVLIEALVDSEGRVAKTRVIQSVPGLDQAALDAVRQWRFHPATKGGKPVATIIHMPVAFRIYNDKK